MEEVLRNLNKEMGVTGSAIVSKDGLVIASALDQNEVCRRHGGKRFSECFDDICHYGHRDDWHDYSRE